MQKKQIFLDSFYLCLIGVVLFGAFLGSYHLITPDEGRYIEVAREMVASHNYVTPYLDGTVFLDKPILYFWLESGVIKLFGLSEWSVRLVPVFFGILGCLFVYWLGRALYNRRSGFLAALILMSSMLYFFSAHYADMDLMVSVLIVGALSFFIIAIKTEALSKGQASICLWLAYLLSALAFLTKGLMGIVFPVMIIGLWIVVLQRWSVILKMRLVSGLILFLIVVSPWLILVEKQNHEFFSYFFLTQQFSRYVSDNFNMQQPFYYYIATILLGMLPWTIFLFQAIWCAVKRVKNKAPDADKLIYLLLWVVAIFIFFSIPKSKIIGYMLPVFPPIALMIALYFDRCWQSLVQSKQLKIAAFVFLVLAMLASFGLVIAAQMPSVATLKSMFYLTLIGMVILLGGVATVALAIYRKRLISVFLALFLTSVCVGVIAIASASTFKLSSVKPLAILIQTHEQPNSVVVAFHGYFQDLPVYTRHKVYVVYDWHNPHIIQEDGWQRELSEDIIYKHKQQKLLIEDQRFQKMWDHYPVFVVLNHHRLDALKKLVNSPVYVWQRYERFMLVSNQPMEKGKSSLAQ